MSSIKLSPNASGTGEFTIAAPNSNTNRTLTLPDQTGTVLTNAGPFTANASASAGAVTIDASNNVGIGTGSPGARLDVNQGGVSGYTLTLDRTSAAGSLGFKYNGTITGQINANSGGGLLFYRGSTPAEAMRIDASGNLLVGTTSQPVSGVTTRLAVVQSIGDYSQVINNSNASPYGLYIKHNTDSNGTGNPFIAAIGNATTRFAVRSNGGIENYSANNVNLSDRREKTNFAPAKSYLETICAIPVQTFNYIDQNQEEDPGLTLGVVAQDVQAVAPELVMESNWGSKDEPKMRLSIYQTDLQYALMKCIQELNAKVAALEARLASDGPSNGAQA